MRSLEDRAGREVVWRKKNMTAIMTIAKFAGVDPLVIGSELSKRICGGRRKVFERGEHVGYA